MSTTTEKRSAAAQIEEIIEPWTRACLDRDWDALLDMCEDDIVFMPPGAEPVAGSAVRPWLDEFPTIKSMSWSVVDIEEEGDFAWLRGPVEQTLEIDGSDERFVGKYVDVMRRGADGRWRFALIMWSSNVG